MEKEDISLPLHSLSFVMDSTERTFSDKLMMFHRNELNAASVGFYASSMAVSLRHDLHLTYARLAAEIAKYAHDGINIMIDNQWMEQPPQAVRHENLVGV